MAKLRNYRLKLQGGPENLERNHVWLESAILLQTAPSQTKSGVNTPWKTLRLRNTRV